MPTSEEATRSGANLPLEGGGRREASGGGDKPFSQKTHEFAKNLRANLTDAEKKLWHMLRNKQLGIKFRRQQAIGKYIADFVNLDIKLIIELDGGQHANSMHDHIRDHFLHDEGYTVLRFWNNDVLENMEGVRRMIHETIEAMSPPPAALCASTSPLEGEVGSAAQATGSGAYLGNQHALSIGGVL